MLKTVSEGNGGAPVPSRAMARKHRGRKRPGGDRQLRAVPPGHRAAGGADERARSPVAHPSVARAGVGRSGIRGAAGVGSGIDARVRVVHGWRRAVASGECNGEGSDQSSETSRHRTRLLRERR